MPVSVLIPSYNAEEWIADSVRSALENVGATGEVIVVDDGSSDQTLARLKPYEDRVQVVAGPHRGGNAARNRLLEHARFEWIQYLDADDYLLPNKVQQQQSEAMDQESDIIYSPVLAETWKDGKALDRVKLDPDMGTDLVCQWISWQLPQTGAALWRKSALEQIGGWNESMPCCQEHELYLRAIMNGLRFSYAPTAGAIYRIWSEQTVCRKDPVLVIKTRTELIDKMLGWLEQTGKMTETHRRTAGRACFEMARTWAKYDLPAAVEYERTRRNKHSLVAAGAAAPTMYRLVYRIFGFALAERMAKALRRG